MTSSEGGYGGVGRRASGPLEATWQMMEWIRDQGRPVHRDEVLEHCAQFVFPGYANRWYAAQLNGARASRKRTSERNAASALDRSQSGRPHRIAEEATPATVDTAKAVRAVLVQLLRDSSNKGRLTRDGDEYTFVRMPKRTPGGMPVEMVTYDPVVQRRHVYALELVRKLREAQARGVFEVGKGTKSLNLAERDALFRWLSTFDGQEQMTVSGVELDAIVVLRNMRDRTESRSPKMRTEEKVALEALWRALDHSA